MSQNIKYKILIVDDDKFLLDMYSIKFSQNGFDVTPAMGSIDALEKLKNNFIPDIILTDVLMPAMDGFEFIETVKKDKLAESSKIVILSNKGEREDMERGASLGIDGYIIKAGSIPTEVLDKVNEILKA